MRKGIGAAIAVLALLMTGIATAATAGEDTTDATIQRGDDRLTQADGEGHSLREELAKADPRRVHGRRVMAFAAQMSDAHVIDEESPLRVEWTDKFGGIFTSAYRPQEGLGPQVLDRMVRQLKLATSVVQPGRRLDAVVTTGDNTDSGQCNETRWMIDVMTGGRTVDPDSGVGPDFDRRFSDRELCKGEGPQVHAPVPPGCDGVETPGSYDGVRGGEYYEPDGDGDGAYARLRDFPGLFEAMNQPFEAEGFGRIPWYAVFGNHDGLIQGNQPRNPGFEALGVGCVRYTAAANLEHAVANAPNKQAAMADALRAMQTASPSRPGAELIEPDLRRRPLRKTEWIHEHMVDDPVRGHGFTDTNRKTGMGNYAFEPRPGERLLFVALDTVSEHGLEEGNVDDDQFRWLHATLRAADESRHRVVVFAHHSLQTMGQPPVSPFLPGDTFGNLDPNVHYGNGPRPTGQKLPCLTADPKHDTYPQETVRCLLLRHPSVIGFVNGHEHNNRIDPITYVDHDPAKRPDRGFWEINTASHIDWPQQSRLLDLVDNADDTISIVATLVDHDSPPHTENTEPSAGDTSQLASISRELSAFEPQAKPASRGEAKDRNVELVVADPFPKPGRGPGS